MSHETNQRSPGRGYGLCMSVIEQICCVQRQGKLLAMVMSQAEFLRKPVSQPILMESVQKVLPVEAEHMLRIPCRLHQNELMYCGNTTWKHIFWAWLIHVTFHAAQDGRLLATIGEDCALKLFEAKRIELFLHEKTRDTILYSHSRKNIQYECFVMFCASPVFPAATLSRLK